MTTVGKHRSPENAPKSVIAFSISYQRHDLLARGMGLDHLRELLIRLARFIIRQRVHLAYGGNWRETDDNFLLELLRLISAEQADSVEQEATMYGSDSSSIGMLYNHSSWPHYLEVTPRIEAQWINVCRSVRVTQRDAGLSDQDIVPDADAKDTADEPRTIFNAAVTLSAMRRMMMPGTTIPITGKDLPETVPPVLARILLGGSVDHYSGFVPAIFEEALVTLEHLRPTYVLGGFGGACEILAGAILAPPGNRAPELTADWHQEHNERLAELLESSEQFVHPPSFRSTAELLDALFVFVEKARAAPAATLNTGLSDADTLELLKTHDIATAQRLVHAGLKKTCALPDLLE